MKKYLLLRDNRQSGPHSIEQLSSMELQTLDLIWIEDESTGWKYPDEIGELKNLIRYDANTQKEHRSANHSEKVFVSLPSNFTQKRHRDIIQDQVSFPVNGTEPVLETNYVRPLEELKENYKATKQKQPTWKRKIVTSANLATVPIIFMGVVLGAFIIKKWVDGYVPSAVEETATAIPVLDREVEKQPVENLQNALATEIVPVYKSMPAKPTKKPNVKKQLRIATNDYKVGLFGGINGLQLTVFNSSAQFVDRVIVGVDYLRPNGSVVQSENVSFSSIKPKGAQTIPIPGSARGVKVRYKILKVYSHEYKADLKQI
jgi:hypothetical protein